MFHNFWVSKNVRDKTGAWASQFSVEVVLPHSTEAYRNGTLVCCASESFPDAKKFKEKRERRL